MLMELVLIACLKAAPEDCEERSLQHLPRVSDHACMVQSQPQIAAWSERHPHLAVERWFCREAGLNAAEA